ncbi:MAG: hypothetical protein ACI4ON_05790 [Clostridia bacterium]
MATISTMVGIIVVVETKNKKAIIKMIGITVNVTRKTTKKNVKNVVAMKKKNITTGVVSVAVKIISIILAILIVIKNGMILIVTICGIAMINFANINNNCQYFKYWQFY